MSSSSNSQWTSSDLDAEQSQNIPGALTRLLADTFALYLKTKNFHWHMSGPHFRDYHLMLDEQGDEIFAMTDVIAERARTLGGTTLRSIGHIARLQRIADNDAERVSADDMIAELASNNQQLLSILRACRRVSEAYGDAGTSSLVDGWIAATERRVWFLSEVSRRA